MEPLMTKIIIASMLNDYFSHVGFIILLLLLSWSTYF